MHSESIRSQWEQETTRQRRRKICVKKGFNDIGSLRELDCYSVNWEFVTKQSDDDIPFGEKLFFSFFERAVM